MATGINETSFGNALKRHYSDHFVESLVYMDKPLLAMMAKQSDPEMVMGSSHVVPVFYGDPQSRSANFSTAATASTSKSPSAEQFLVTMARDYAVGSIDGMFLRQMKGDKNAFWTKLTQIINSYMRPTSESAAISLYREGWGDRGIVSAIASNVITLSRKADVVNFQKGMDLVFSSSQNAAVLRDSGNTGEVTDVNRNTGEVTIASTPTGVAANDYIFVNGDRENSASPTQRMMLGLEAWLPASAPSSTAHHGVDRTSDSRLYGVSVDGTDALIDDALLDAVSDLQTNGCPGGDDMACFMNHEQANVLNKILRSKEEYNPVQVSLTREGRRPITFRGVTLDSPLGHIKVIPDRFCPVDRAYILKMSTWKLLSLGKIPDVLNHGNIDSQWLTSDDGIQVRVGYYGNPACNAPGWNANVQLSLPE